MQICSVSKYPEIQLSYDGKSKVLKKSLADVFVHPSLVVKLKLTDGLHLKANAIKSYNQDKKIWSWKVFSI